jgi:hypothetical protein
MGARLMVWGFGVVVSLLPLGFVASTLLEPNGGPTFLQAIANEELLAVAFTLGAVAAVDALINSRARLFSIGIGVITLVLTISSIGIYMLLKFKIAHWPPEATVIAIQSLCAGTVLTSFLCESQS